MAAAAATVAGISPAATLRLKPFSATVRFFSLRRKILPRTHLSILPSHTPITNKNPSFCTHYYVNSPFSGGRTFSGLIAAALSSGEAIEKQKAGVLESDKVGKFRKRLRIVDIKGGPDEGLDKLGENIVVKGWVRTLRVQSSVTFIEVNDGSCLSNMQCVVSSDAQGYDQDKTLTTIDSIGAFQKLPMVMPSVDIFYSALKKAKRVPPTKGIANIAKRERNRGAKQLDALMKELAVSLRTYKEKFPRKQDLHPYERSLTELTLGDGNYEEVMRKVEALRKKVVSVGKEHAALCAKSLTKKEAEERLNEGMKILEEIFQKEGKAVDELLNIAKTLRAMPVVDLETPTLCLVGAPNVGKSSLVRILSTGKPEICNYPFTTRGILMGHIHLSYQNFQVTDTPGILRRRDEDRNNLEKLTLAVLSHLPTAVLYVHDLSGECGTSPSDQYIIYKEIRERFSDHLWIDVVSKCDLLLESPVVYITEDSSVDDIELARYRKMGPDGSMRVSVTNEVGLEELKSRVHEMLVSQLARIKIQDSEQEKVEEPKRFL